MKIDASIRLLPNMTNFGLRMGLFEENYQRLSAMLGPLQQATGAALAELPGMPKLYRDIVDQSRYTTVLRLTHGFVNESGLEEFDPCAWIRLYHDTKQAEITHCYIARHVRKLFDTNEPLLRVGAHRQRYTTLLSKWLVYLGGFHLQPGDFVQISALPPAVATLLVPKQVDAGLLV